MKGLRTLTLDGTMMLGLLLAASLVSCGLPTDPEQEQEQEEEQEVPADWQSLPSLPLPVRAAAAATDGLRVYVVGGTGVAGRTPALQILEFGSGSWSYGPPIPSPTDWGAAAWMDGELHFVGGVTNTASATTQHLVYDPQANDWSPAAPLPVQKAGTAAISRGSKLYVFAGNSGGSPAYTSSTLIYDGPTDSWSTGLDVPGARINWSGALADDRFFLAGGGIAGLETSGDLLVYDPDADSWSGSTPLPFPREAHGVAVAGGLVCVIGGREAADGNFNQPFGDVSCYDPAGDSWLPAPRLPRARQEVAAVAIGDYLIALGGADESGVPVGDVITLRVQ